MNLPDLSRYDVIAFDTETTGLDTKARPVGLSVATPDGQAWYFAWGHGDPLGASGGPEHGNNCNLADVRAWAKVELTRPGVTRVAHNAAFDLRMLAYHGITGITGVEDTQVCAVLLNEHRLRFSLNGLAGELGLGEKSDTELLDFCARTYGGKPTRLAQGANYWRVPVSIMQPYAEHDAELTRDVFARMRPEIRQAGLEKVYALETDLIPVLLRMHLAGVRADRGRARVMRGELQHELDQLERAWHRDYGAVNYRSADELQPVLDRLGIAYPLTPKTKKPSIKKDWLEALDHPLGQQVRRMRQVQHYIHTFIDGYILDNGTDANDVLHPEFHALKGDEYGTISGRLSSGGEMNAQNIPARDEEWGPKIRSLFRPMRDSQVWVKLDYSQIEYRFFAHFAGEHARNLARKHKGDGTSAMEEAYIANPDIDFHQWVADTAHIARKRAKNVNFCRLYGGGIPKIALTAGCSIEEATEFVGAYDTYIPEANALAEEISALAARRGFVKTWYGRVLRFQTEGERAVKYKTAPRGNAKRYAMTHAALNRVLQGSSADLTKLAMIEVDKVIDYDATILHLSVHDELDLSVERSEAERVVPQLRAIMQDVARQPSWNGHVMRVPVLAEPDVGPNWGMLG